MIFADNASFVNTMFLARKVGSIAAACKTINICSITEGIFKQQDRSILSLLSAKQFHGSPVHSYSIEPEQDAVVIGEGDRKYEPQSPYRRVWPKHFQFVHSTNFGRVYYLIFYEYLVANFSITA